MHFVNISIMMHLSSFSDRIEQGNFQILIIQ